MRTRILLLFMASTLWYSCKKSSEVTPGTPPDSFYENDKGQTPIDIITSQAIPYRSSSAFLFHYLPFDGSVTYNKTSYEADANNTEHPAAHDEYNLKVSVPAGNTDNYVVINGSNYYLSQFHFHWASEHKIDGKQSAMEVHLVHRSNSGQFAVIGVLIDEGSANSVLQSIFDASPTATGVTNTLIHFDPLTLLPADQQQYFTYSGSLTTPGGGLTVIPYLEGLKWFVFKSPLTISTAQFNQYKAIYHEPNARQVQPLGNRKVYQHTT
ncbi:MAG: hypothetical protein JWQ09_3738 [Segetibacter sp.]|nr:hypothetical protein [Segetibacter sp.]